MWRLIARGSVLAILAVILVPAAFAQPAFIGFLEKPAEGSTVVGMVLVQGYAVDPSGISRVDLYVDDVFQYSADINLPRIDIVEAHPDWEGIQNRLPGFQTGFQASRFSNGPHIISLRVVTSDNQTFEIGRRTVLVDGTKNQSPFGYVDAPDSVAIYDVNGSFPVAGWATDTDGVARVDVLIDNLNYQSAIYGSPRPDVGNSFPDFPAALFSGFVAEINSTRIQDGVHVLQVRATDRRGLSRIIGTRNIQVFNSEANLRPFGRLDEPIKDATLFGSCGNTVPVVSPGVRPDSHLTAIRGWALDLGTREDTGRISYAELLIDGARIVSTDDCTYVGTIGNVVVDSYVNCYGLPRFDVAKYYPTYPDSPRSGFMFLLDIGTLLKKGGGFFNPGHHVVKIRVGDQEQTFADIPNTAGVNVFFQCVQDVPSQGSFNSPPFGFIDFPTNFDYLKGTVTFFGWAIDENPTDLARIEILIDGIPAGNASTGYTRTDVHDAYPFIFGSTLSGWRFNLDTTQLSDARHRLVVQGVERNGRKTIIGSRDFYVNNPQN